MERAEYAHRELALATAELRDALSPGTCGVVMGLLHVQARVFHALEGLGALPQDLGVAMLAADIESGHELAGMPLVDTVLRALHALLILAETQEPPEAG